MPHPGLLDAVSMPLAVMGIALLGLLVIVTYLLIRRVHAARESAGTGHAGTMRMHPADAGEAGPHLPENFERKLFARSGSDPIGVSLQAALDHSDHGLLITDDEDRIIRHNARFAELWQIPAEILHDGGHAAVVNHIASQIISPRGFLERLAHCRQESAGEQHIELAMRNARRIHLRVSPFRLDEHRSGLIYDYRDVTEPTKVAEALDESGRMYRAIFEQATEGIYIADAESLAIVEANPAYLGMSGYTEEDLTSMTIYDLVDHPRESIDFHIERVLEQRVHYIGERRHRSRDGRPIEVEASASLINHQGREALCIMLRDLGSQKETERTLQEVRRYYGEMLDTLPLEVALLDPQGRYIYINPAGLPDKAMRKWLPGHTDYDLVQRQGLPANVAARRMKTLADALEEGRPLEMEESYTLPETGTRVVSRTYAPMADAKGEFSHVINFSADITRAQEAMLALRSSEERYRAFYQDSPAMHFTLDSDGKVLSVNRFGALQLGYAPSELVGLPVFNVIHPDDRSKVSAQLRDLQVNADRTSQWQLRKVHKDGHILWVEEQARVLPGGEGVPQILLVCNDISDKKWAEDALRASEERYRMLFNNSLDPIIVHEILPDGRASNIVQVNASTCETLGYSRQELLALHPADLIPERWHADYAAATKQLLEDRETVFETALQTQTGEELIVEVRGHLFQLHGRSTVVSIARDITEHKRRLKGVQESEKWLRTVLEAVPAGVLVLSASRRVLYANSTLVSMVGFEEAELYEKRLADMLHSDSAREAERRIERLLAGQNLDPYRYRVKVRSGDEMNMEVHSRRVMYRGTPAILSFLYDLSDHVRMEQELHENERQLRLITDSLPVCIAYIDGEQRYVFNNRTYEEWFSPPEGGFRGRHVREVLGASAYNAISPYIDRVLAGEVVSYEKNLLYPDNLKRFVQGHMVPALDDDGSLRGFYDMVTDISRLKLTEKALRLSEQKYSQLLEIAREGIVVLNSDGTLAYANPRMAEMLGFTVEEMLSSPMQQFLGTNSGAVFQGDPAAEPGKNGTAGQEDVEFIRRDGSSLHASVRTSAFYGDGEESVGTLAIIVDISERKRMEVELRQHRDHLEGMVRTRTQELVDSREAFRNLSARIERTREEERKRIAREIHDELGQVLSALKIDLHWLEGHFPPSKKVLFDKTSQMSGQIESTIKTVQRISQELRPPMLDELGFTDAVAWYLEDFQERNEIRCSLQIEPETLEVAHNISVALFRILQEALTNVSRHARASEVTVSLHAEDVELRFDIIDNGVGISREHVTSTRSLGLIGIKERIHSLSGSVEIHGSSEGTRISVVLPFQKRGRAND